MHRSKAHFFEALGSRNEKPPHEKKAIPENREHREMFHIDQ
jgi:hypothetical protein